MSADVPPENRSPLFAALRAFATHPMRDRSLRLRLLVFFAVFLLFAWLAAAFSAWRESRTYIDKFFDTQQMLFAKTLVTAEFDPLAQKLPKTKKILKGAEKKARGKEDKNALGFAVFNSQGELLLSDGERGERFFFDGWTRGFSNTQIQHSNDLWRLVWLISPDGNRIIAVGQELDYRDKMALAMLIEQIKPWLMLLPVLLAGLLWMISRELAPLHHVAEKLDKRSAQDTSELDTTGIPSEVRPLVTALNNLFVRTGTVLARERAFISDAAHELRTPLSGLRVQAEVVELSADDPQARQHAVAQLTRGIDRCGHLLEQLLTLSRVEAFSQTAEKMHNTGDFGADSPHAQWPALVEEVLREYRPRAAEKDMTMEFTVEGTPPPVNGQSSLLAVLIRNLLDNAVKYAPEKGRIGVTLDSRSLSIRNSGPGVPDAWIGRLGERFFRPPGQIVPGSGLGLSIASHVAETHAMRLSFENTFNGCNDRPDGFLARLSFHV